MKKLISTFVLTVAVCGSSFAEETLLLQQPPVALKQRDMGGSMVLGCGNDFVTQDRAGAPLKKVKSKEDLHAGVDSDDEEIEVKAQISRQNSQENLMKLTQQEQNSGWSVKLYNAFVSVKNAFASAWQTVKSWF